MVLSDDQKSAHIQFVLEPIHYMKSKAVTQAALDYATTAVTIALGLIGIMALWLGVMKVAERRASSRLSLECSRRSQRDSSRIPPDHPGCAAMIMNIAAHMLD